MPFTFNPFTGKLDFYEASSRGTVTSVSGTANRITVTNPTTTPVIDIAATYVGQTSITTLGTIVTGVWNGTAVDATHGGTAQTSWTTGDLLYASGANTLAKLAIGSESKVLTVSGGVPSWQTAEGLTQVAFSAYMSAATQAVGPGTTVVQCDTELFDNSSNYNAGTYTFTAPNTGIYYFGGAIYSQVASGIWFLEFVATSITVPLNTNYPTAQQSGLMHSALISMTAGDTCKFQVGALNAFTIANAGFLGSGFATYWYGYQVA